MLRSVCNFSIHEHGVYDLPASIDYILQKTNQSSVFGLGYSIGATVFLIMCTEKPEYNAKIKLFNSLAGVGSPHNSMTPLIKFWMSMIPPSVVMQFIC